MLVRQDVGRGAFKQTVTVVTVNETYISFVEKCLLAIVYLYGRRIVINFTLDSLVDVEDVRVLSRKGCKNATTVKKEDVSILKPKV